MENATRPGPTGILHVCGGDPGRNKEISITNEYSPRMWR